MTTECDNLPAYQRFTLAYHVLFHITGVLPFEQRDEPNAMRRALKNGAPMAYWFAIDTIDYTMYAGYVIRKVMEHRLELDTVCEWITTHGIILRHILLFLGRRDLSVLLADCRALWTSFVASREDALAVRSFERKARTFGKVFCSLSFATITVYILSSQLVGNPSLEVNGTSSRVLPFKFYVEVHEQPWFALCAALQVTVAYSITLITTCIETLVPFLAMMACGYLRTVTERLVDMASVGDGGREIVDESLANRVLVCVKFHQRILEFCEKLDRFTRSLFFVQVMCTLYNMSLIGLKILKEDDEVAKYVLLFANNLIQFFACQWVSQHLFDQSAAVGDAAYCAAWSSRQFNLKTNKMLYLMILRAGKPVQLTAIGVVRLSLETFKNMMVNAFSFFTVLRNFDA